MSAESLYLYVYYSVMTISIVILILYSIYQAMLTFRLKLELNSKLPPEQRKSVLEISREVLTKEIITILQILGVDIEIPEETEENETENTTEVGMQ